MFTKKAQIATEFILTYGWALLIITTVIGAFLFIQIDAKDIISPHCSFTETMTCMGHDMNDDTLIMELRNDLNTNLNILDVICESQQKTSTATNVPQELSPKENKIINCTFDEYFEKAMHKFKVTIYYKVHLDTFPKSIEGQVIARNI